MRRQPARPAAKARAARDRSLAVGFSLCAHATILVALLGVWRAAPPPLAPPPVDVTLVSWPAPPAPPAKAVAPPPAASPAPARAASAKPPPPRLVAPVPSPIPSPSAVAVRATDQPPAPAAATGTGASSGTGEAELAAGGAGGGAPGGACDMAARLRSALRRDPLVQAAVSHRGGGAILVWNGDWVQSDGEDGKGLAAVREAIIWEIAFAPAACRSQAVRGLVLLSLNDAAGGRLTLGSDRWRWSDLLRPR
jgi:hypothetical protein